MKKEFNQAVATLRQTHALHLFLAPDMRLE